MSSQPVYHTLTAFKDMVRRGQFVVLDTETTGLHQGEICQIAIVNFKGEMLLDTLVKPANPIPVDAQRIHGISNEMVADALPWGEIMPTVKQILNNRDVVVYNASYDRRMMYQSAEAAGLPPFEWKLHGRWWCAMELFAEIYGDWNDYHGSYRWQKLETAARYYKLGVTNAHSALGDCLMTLGVAKAMAWDGRP